jgi:hypothetical protein
VTAELPNGGAALALNATIWLRMGVYLNPSAHGPAALAAATIPPVRQLPERCASCGCQIATLERCVLPDGTLKRGAEVFFRESAQGEIRCEKCAREDG